MTTKMQHYRLDRIEAGQGTALTLLDLPAGAELADGTRCTHIDQAGTALDITRWQHDRLQLSLDPAQSAPDTLTILALSKQSGQHGRYTIPLRRIAPTEGLHLSGLSAGAVLTDGQQGVESHNEAQMHDLAGWQLDHLTLTPPKGQHARIALKLHVGRMSEEVRASLGQLRLRLASPNAYLVPEQEELTHTSLPKMEIVVGKLGAESRHSVSLRAQPVARGTVANTATDLHAAIQGFKVLDDDELEALEKKFRN